MYQYRIFMLAGVVCLLAGCFTDPRERAIGQVYAGPASTAMRKDLSLQADTIAELKHGERLEVLQFRRRFVKARNMGGAEGWIDSRYLLTQSQIDDLRQLAAQAATLPSQGKATVFDLLNVHSEPNRSSPSPYQIAPGTHVDMVAHAAAQRVPYKSPVMEIAAKRRQPPPRKTKKKLKSHDEDDDAEEAIEKQLLPPPMPAAPRLPTDFNALSRVGRETGSAKGADADDWTLVRLSPGQSGWVLSRNLLVGIPDSIAKLAGGHRIMAALPLGEVTDGTEKRNHWLWATVGDRLRPYQFDSIRLFAYNLKRHRVETVLWEKDLRGFYPITLEQVRVADKHGTGATQGFSVIVEEPDGQRWKRTYSFQNNRAKLVKKEPVDKPAEPPRPAHLLYSSLPLPPSPEVDRTIVNRVKDMLKR